MGTTGNKPAKKIINKELIRKQNHIPKSVEQGKTRPKKKKKDL